MSDKDYDYIVKVEKAIAEKYGEDTVKNPRSFWNKDKEAKHREQLKEFYNKIIEKEEGDKERVGDVLISKKLLNKESNRECPVCDSYSFSRKDDFYMNKFECWWDCYIQYVEGREERWSTGWRPENTRAIMK